MNFTEFKQSQNARRPHLLLLGHPVSQSLSPLMHNTAAEHYGMDVKYFAVDLQEHEFASIASHFNNDSFIGTNITVPYKEMFMQYVDAIEPLAREIGAINTILKEDSQLKATNTDIYGFLKPLESAADELFGMRAIVFGTGGAAKAVVAGLVDIGLEEIVIVSRSPNRVQSFDKYDRVQMVDYNGWQPYSGDASLLVNTTPLGMAPNVDSSPVRETEKEFLADKICYDIVYKPQQTKFLKLAAKSGARCIGGLEMLVYQGSESFRRWTGKPFPIPKIKQTLYEYLKQ